MKKIDWNPDLYLKFDKERIQPSIDLVRRINFEHPNSIIDIGCGPGNSTQILVQRWSESKIIGIDSSPSMIKKAKKDFPNQEWKILDVSSNEISGTYDIVFSNATIQWIPNHSDLLKRFYKILSDKGVLAVQLPLFWDMLLGRSIANIARDSQWASATKGVTELFTIHDYSYYYDQLSELYDSVEMWESNYMHILESQQLILEMVRSTGLKPYLERIEKHNDKIKFEKIVLKEIKRNYPKQKNGKVILPFKRLFFIATK